MGGKGGPDVYQSPYSGQTDDLGFQTALGMISGQGVSPSPALNSSVVAQQLGGKYDNKTGNITMKDGSQIRYDALSGQFQNVGPGNSVSNFGQYYAQDPTKSSTISGFGAKEGHNAATGNFKTQDDLQSYVDGGGTVYDRQGNPVNFATGTTGTGGQYLDQANQTVSGLNTNVYNNPSSAYNMFNASGAKTYNPTSGQYEDASTNSSTTNGEDALSSSSYMKNYGGYLDHPYNSYAKYNPELYQSYNYQSPTVKSVDNVSKAAKENEYQSGASNITNEFGDQTKDNTDFARRQGSSLSSGRLARMNNDTQMKKQTALEGLRRGVDQEYELRNYNDAAHVRDLQTAQDAETQKLNAGENQYGQTFNQGENRYGYEAGQKENQYAYESGQNQGREKLQAVEAINTANRGQAFQELQAQRQQEASKMSALLDMLRVYGGEDSTAVQLAAAQAQAAGAALGGLTSGIGSAAGGYLSKKP